MRPSISLLAVAAAVATREWTWLNLSQLSTVPVANTVESRERNSDQHLHIFFQCQWISGWWRSNSAWHSLSQSVSRYGESAKEKKMYSQQNPRWKRRTPKITTRQIHYKHEMLRLRGCNYPIHDHFGGHTNWLGVVKLKANIYIQKSVYRPLRTNHPPLFFSHKTSWLVL